MSRWADLVLARPLAIVGVVVALTVLAVTQVVRLRQDDDVLRFLPPEALEVQAFAAISERFGAMEVALVAVEAGDADGLYTHARLVYLRELTRLLGRLPEVHHLTSIAELAVIERSDDGAAHVALVPADIPSDAAALAAIRQRVLGLDYLEGLLASADGSSAVIVAQLRTTLPDGTVISGKRAAEAVARAAADLAMPPGARLHFGGAPFITEAVASGSQADLERLGPFVGALTLLVVTFALGSLLAALYTLLTVGVAITWTLGLMGAIGLPLTLVSNSLPVILVALGSAQAMHLLVAYRARGADARAALGAIAWPLVATTIALALVFAAFAVMDVAPLRELGALMAIGVALSAALALTLLPALLALKPIAPRAGLTRVDAILAAVGRACRRRRIPVLAGAALVAALLATRLPHVVAHSDPSAFFEPGSPPAEANRLLSERFGGSVFLQVLVDADMRDPAVLHRVAAFEDRLRGVPGASRPQGITDVLAVVHEGLKGERRLSRSRDEIEQLGFLAGKTDPSVSLLVDEAWRGGLIQIGLGRSDAAAIAAITEAVQALAERHLVGRAALVDRTPERAATVYRDAAERVAALVGKSGEPGVTARLEAALVAPIPAGAQAAITKAIDEVIQREIVEDEMVALADPSRASELARALASDAIALRLDRPTFDAHLRRALAASELADARELERSAGYLYTQLELAFAPAVRQTLVDALTAVTGPLDPNRALRLAAIADEVLQPRWFVSLPVAEPGAPVDASGAIAVTVSGQPVIQQAMAISARSNIVTWLAVSLPLALLLLGVAFRSVVAALVGLVPAGLTLLVGFGVMGLFPDALPLDLATCLLTAMALGVGLDYAVHFLWRHREGDLEVTMRETGRAVWFVAIEIAAGFGVLGLASIAPVSRFGLLTAQTLFVAALATLVLLPALLAWWNPSRVRARVAEPEEIRT